MLRLVASLLAALWLSTTSTARAEGLINDDGLHTQAWFAQSLLDLRDDLAEAKAAGKRFVVIWEQKGCPYCRDLHTINFADAKLADWIRQRFHILQLNLRGDREVTDFDGTPMPEKDLARKYRITFTPTIQFFPEDVKEGAGKSGMDIEVARMPGYFRPFHFISMFEYVWDKRYAGSQTFQDYIVEKSAAGGK